MGATFSVVGMSPSCVRPSRVGPQLQGRPLRAGSPPECTTQRGRALPGLANYGSRSREVVMAREARRTSRDLLVEWRVDFRDLLRLARLVRLRLVVASGLAAEVEALEAESVGAVGVDLLERREQLLLGRGPRVGRDSAVDGAELDRPVALETGRGRDQL